MFDPMLVKDFKSGEQLTFSTKDHPRNFGVDISFKYPKHWEFEEDEFSESTGIGLSSDYMERSRILLITPIKLPEEIMSLTAEEKKYLVHNDIWIKNNFTNDNNSIVKSEKTVAEKIPATFVVTKNLSGSIYFSLDFIYNDTEFAVGYLLSPPEEKSATYDLKTEEAVFKAICDSLKIQKINKR
jgi:hypothetical protein